MFKLTSFLLFTVYTAASLSTKMYRFEKVTFTFYNAFPTVFKYIKTVEKIKGFMSACITIVHLVLKTSSFGVGLRMPGHWLQPLIAQSPGSS